jgi:hypothetical protein
MTADSSGADTEMKKDPLGLAGSVAERVEIRNVLLAECKAIRSSAFSTKQDGLKLATGVSKLGFGRDEESNRLFVTLTFRVALSPVVEADAEAEVQLRVTATFVVAYSVKSFEGIGDDHIRAFSAINGVFNAWPYWREFVQNTTARMGLPMPVVIPVYRLGENPFEEFPDELDSTADASSGSRTTKGS